MIKKISFIEMLILVVALVILLTAVLTFNVHAQELANNATVNSHTERSAGKNTNVVFEQ